MANHLIIYNSGGTAQQLASANIAFHEYPDAEVLDISGVTTGDVTSAIAALDDDYYTNIFIAATTQQAGATGVVSFDQVASLRAKMIAASKGTTIRANTCGSNADATDIVLDAGASADNDYYNDMYIVTEGVTAVYRHIKDYVGATKVCDVTDTTTPVTTTSTFIIWTNTNVFELGNTDAATGKTAAYRMFETLYPSATVPLVVHYIGGYLFADASGTAASAAAGTITLASTTAAGNRYTTTQHTTIDDLYAGCWVYIYSGTLGVWQKAKIKSYVASTQVATLESNWLITPTGTIVYRVVNAENLVRCDRAVEIYVKTRWYDITNIETRQEVASLINLYNELQYGSTGTIGQDLALLAKIVELGSFTFESDALGVV